MNRRQLLAIFGGTGLATAISACDPVKPIRDLGEIARLANMPDQIAEPKAVYQVPKDLHGKIDAVIQLLRNNYDCHSLNEKIDGEISVEQYERRVSNPPTNLNVKLTVKKDFKGADNAYVLEISRIAGPGRKGFYFRDHGANGLGKKGDEKADSDFPEMVSELVIGKDGTVSAVNGKTILDLTPTSVAQLNDNYSNVLDLLLTSESFHKPGKRQEEGISRLGYVPKPKTAYTGPALPPGMEYDITIKKPSKNSMEIKVRVK